MSWFKENKFSVCLGGGTLVAAILLYMFGAKGSASYDKAKENFDAASGEVSNILKLQLAPTEANRDSKTKALDDYRKSIETLQADFEPYRPKEIKNVSPQEFTNNLKSVNDEVRKAFETAETKVPDPFFCGFEKYKTNVASGSTTGILEYQLSGIKSLMLSLAKSGIKELKNVDRPALLEEEGKEYKPADSEVARPLPLEVTFIGSEKSARAFLTSITKTDGPYTVIRSLRIANIKKDPPRTADAKFDKPNAKPAATSSSASVFGGGFVLPGEEPKPADKKDEPTPAPAPAPAPSDSSRILSQVLGNEDVAVFLRLDVMQFLPTKKLP